ncbi:MAG: OmpA family protein [Treponema sp.]|nr:OmpA family protein [Treponema sp.]
MKGFRLFVTGIVLSAAAAVCFAQTAGSTQSVALKYSGTGGYSLVERTNLRRYVNGKYVGLTSREVRSFISPSLSPDPSYENPKHQFYGDQWYDGSFYVLEETRRNMENAAAGIHDSIPSVFHISSKGKVTMYADNGYPSFRSFPAFTTDRVKSGDSWSASAERSVDPLNKGIFTRMPMEVAYTFIQQEKYHEEDVYRLKAIWQTNYGVNHRDFDGDKELQKAIGGHKADILIRKATGEPMLVVDTVDETFIYADGQQVNFKGTITLFTEFPPAIDTNKLILSLKRIASVSPDVTAGGSGKKNGTVTLNGNGGKKKVAPDDYPGSVNTSSWVATTEPKSKPATKPSAQPSKSSTAVAAATKNKNNMVVEKTTAGLRLSVRDIRFKPDSSEILPTESGRLDEIAEVLKLAPKSQFLVEGHTAAVGRAEGEQKLSVERAHKIAEELAKRGVSSAAFICRGWGGTKPIADNGTDEGRAQNRRVEITILE